MFFERDLSKIFLRYEKFPVIAVVGPRQSGKTTLVRHYFKEYAYVNLEHPERRAFAAEDPQRFLNQFGGERGVIIDEFQYVPELLSYSRLNLKLPV